MQFINFRKPKQVGPIQTALSKKIDLWDSIEAAPLNSSLSVDVSPSFRKNNNNDTFFIEPKLYRES